MPPEVAVAHYEAQRRQGEATAILVRRQWRQMDAGDLEGSWARIVTRLTSMLSLGMLGAARAGSAYVTDAAGESEAAVVSERFAGTASDGRPLDSLLFAAVVHVKERIGAGLGPAQSLSAGGKWLDMLARTQVADVGRGATQVAVAARPGVGYTRLVSAPCCQRCAVLAGKFFRFNDGFLRHPRCACTHSVCTQAEFPGMVSEISPDQIHDLSEAQREAISAGADLGQVVNARRGSSGMTTSEGATRRGLAGQRGVRRRLTPEGIFRVASTREQAIELLKRHGYLI
jgi:hypothetical protein